MNQTRSTSQKRRHSVKLRVLKGEPEKGVEFTLRQHHLYSNCIRPSPSHEDIVAQAIHSALANSIMELIELGYDPASIRISFSRKTNEL